MPTTLVINPALGEHPYSATVRVGLWSSVIALVAGLGYIGALLATLGGLIDGPRATAYQLAPSLLLAWSYLALLACILGTTAPDRKIWALLGLCFALIYSTINSIVYFAQLLLVIPAQLAGEAQSLSLLFFEPGKFLFTINGLAYGLMSVAALFSSGTFARLEGHAALRWAMVAHGLLAPFIVGALIWPSLVYVGALWIVTFPVMSVLLTLHFHGNCTGASRSVTPNHSLQARRP